MWNSFDENEEEWDDEGEFDPRREHEHIYNHPMMKKAKEILGLTRALVGSLDEARKELYGSIMMENALILNAKFASAESISDYTLKMEKAVIMKVHAKNLNSMTYQLALEATHAEEHLNLLREAVEEFRKLFKEWILSFDSNEKMDDGWGIFTD